MTTNYLLMGGELPLLIAERALRSGASLVMVDNGEIYREKADAFRKQGYTVAKLDFRNPDDSAQWNPLAEFNGKHKIEELVPLCSHIAKRVCGRTENPAEAMCMTIALQETIKRCLDASIECPSLYDIAEADNTPDEVASLLRRYLPPDMRHVLSGNSQEQEMDCHLLLCRKTAYFIVPDFENEQKKPLLSLFLEMMYEWFCCPKCNILWEQRVEIALQRFSEYDEITDFRNSIRIGAGRGISTFFTVTDLDAFCDRYPHTWMDLFMDSEIVPAGNEECRKRAEAAILAGIPEK